MEVISDLSKAVDPTSYEKKPSKKKRGEADEAAMAREQFGLFMRAYETKHKDYLELKEKCNQFYLGNQWSDKDLRKLEEEGRPALTINMVLSTVNSILGEQIGRRVDIQYKPRREASSDGAIALSKLALSITDQNQYHWLESAVFADGLIEERGYFDVRMNFDDNIEGECEIESVDGGEIVPDPNASDYDPAKWGEVYRIRWMNVDQVCETYGEEWRDKVESIVDSGNHFGSESIRRTRRTFGDKEENEPEYFFGADGDESKGFIHEIRVIERQFKKNVLIYSLVDQTTGRYLDLPPDTKKDEAEKVAKRFGAPVVKRIKQKVRWRVTADRFVLHDDWSIYRTYSIIPYFPYFRRGNPMGVIRNLISPQEQVNKLSSQELHIVNTTANSGWVVEKGALHGMTADDLRAQGSKTGVVIEVNPGRRDGVEKIKPNTIPTGIDRISAISKQNIKEISGISDAMLGLETGEVSGVALESKERRGQVQIQVPIDNLSRTRHLVARKLLELMQDFYTEERIIYYTNDMEPGQPSEQMVINGMDEEGNPVNDVTVGDYDIVISTLPARDNFRDSQFAEALNLRNVGVAVPDYRVVQYSNLAHKDEVAAEMRQLAGLGEKSPEQMEMEQRQLEAQIGELEAKVEDKMAQAKERMSKIELNMAKAAEATQSAEMKERELEYKDVSDVRNVELRERLAALQAINKLDVTELASRLKEIGVKDGNKQRE